jgi:hypothetical protein
MPAVYSGSVIWDILICRRHCATGPLRLFLPEFTPNRYFWMNAMTPSGYLFGFPFVDLIFPGEWFCQFGQTVVNKAGSARREIEKRSSAPGGCRVGL